ncbi:MAG: RluA family pseudouridine synthase [Lentisphaerae bacterium]|nr:RluA family pseudouridine synthase [Lentisphaerota bacterium]
MSEFKVERPDAGTRLRDYLAKCLSVSGNRAKSLLDNRQVFVNGQRVWMAGHTLTGGDTVRVLQPPAPTAPRRVPIRVLHEDAEYLIVDKPAGMLTNGPASVELQLRDERSDSTLIVAHRLDQDTSGCLLVARGPAAFAAAIELFRTHAVEKEYTALVMGRPHPPAQTIDANIDGLTAVTRMRTLKATPAASHVALQTLTGRTHQIRRHLADIGHPVLGDRQYGPQHGLSPAFMQVPRQMLHATLLQFPHPTAGKLVTARSTPPPDFRTCLKAFGLDREPG